MAAIPTQVLDVGGTCDEPTFQAATASDDYDCGPGFFAVVRVGATATTVTLDDPRLIPTTRKATTNVIFTSISNTEKWIPLPRDLANSDGRCVITTNQQTGVTVACIKVP